MTVADFEIVTAPHKEPARDHLGRYLLPHPTDGSTGTKPWQRVTTLADMIDDKYMLHLWKMRMVAAGIGRDEGLYALSAGLDPDINRDALNKVTEDAQTVAGARRGSQKGTALHAFCETLDLGNSPIDQVPSPFRPYVEKYAREMATASLRVWPNLIERIVVCPDLGTAGTLDRGLTRADDPTCIIGDLKTEKGDFKYSALKTSIQLAIYANSPHMWDSERGCYVDPPEWRKDYAIVMHMPSNAPIDAPVVNFWRVDIEAGWQAAQVAMEIREWRKRGKGMMVQINFDPPGPSYATTDRPVTEPVAPEQTAEPVTYARYRYPDGDECTCSACDDPRIPGCLGVLRERMREGFSPDARQPGEHTEIPHTPNLDAESEIANKAYTEPATYARYQHPNEGECGCVKCNDPRSAICLYAGVGARQPGEHTATPRPAPTLTAHLDEIAKAHAALDGLADVKARAAATVAAAQGEPDEIMVAIGQLTTRAGMSELYRAYEASAPGRWTPEHTAAGLARLTSLGV